jgi:hypothetical protein
MTDKPKHRDIAAGHLVSAEETIDELGPADRAIALAQTHALIAIGHALVDLAQYGIEVYTASDPAILIGRADAIPGLIRFEREWTSDD